MIFNSTFIGRANQKNKGKISRYLANKCAIASRVDCFSEMPTTKFGETLKDQMEERLKFLASGTKPRKNKDVMKEVIDQLKDEGLFYGDKIKLKKDDDDVKKESETKETKKDKKRKHSEITKDEESKEDVRVEEPEKKKKKKSSK